MNCGLVKQLSVNKEWGQFMFMSKKYFVSGSRKIEIQINKLLANTNAQTGFNANPPKECCPALKLPPKKA